MFKVNCSLVADVANNLNLFDYNLCFTYIHQEPKRNVYMIEELFYQLFFTKRHRKNGTRK